MVSNLWKLEIGNFGEMPINEEGIPFDSGSIRSFLEWYRQGCKIAWNWRNLMKTRKRFPAGREDNLLRSSTSSGKSSVEGTKNCVLLLHSNPLVPFSQLGIPDRKSCSIYRHSPPRVNIGMCRPQRVWFLGLFSLKTGIHFAYFGLESSMVFERSTWAYEPTVIVSIPNE